MNIDTNKLNDELNAQAVGFLAVSILGGLFIIGVLLLTF